MRSAQETQQRIAHLIDELHSVEGAESEARGIIIGQVSALSWVLGEFDWSIALMAALKTAEVIAAEGKQREQR